jgi:EAL domain-containing protein (putative c-di-GMP-specific phosphodiesterase class I)
MSLAEQRACSPALRYAVNLSRTGLMDRPIYDRVGELLEHTRLDPTAIAFEVSEAVALN